MPAILFELIAIVCYIFMRHLSLFKYYFGEVTDKKGSQFVQEKCATVFKDIPMDGRKEQNADEQPDSILVVLRQMWPMALNIFINAVVTFSVFPAIFADVQSSLAPANSLWVKFFVPVGCFLMSSLAGFSGRMSTAFIHIPRGNSLLLPLFIIARGLFIPLIMLCNVSPRKHTTPWFPHDAWFIIFNILFVFSDGYLTTFITSCGPNNFANQNVHEEYQKVKTVG
uniref:Uncharacterized protein n=2 Tax=Eptatretus burgeri TaxID=7764 RepID=A0A8C4RCE0_EPTBU